MIKANLKNLGFLAIASFVLSACAAPARPAPAPDESPAPGSQLPGGPAQPQLPGAPVADAPPDWSTDPADELARFDDYLIQAGFNNPDQLLSEKEVQACDVLAHQGSGTFNSGVTQSCTWQQSEPGWVVESVRVDVLENKHDRGSYTEDIIAADGQFDLSVKEVGDQWTAAIDLAAKAKDVEVEKKLSLAYQHHMERVVSMSSNKNSVYLEVLANGGLFQSSTIHVIAYAKLVRLQ